MQIYQLLKSDMPKWNGHWLEFNFSAIRVMEWISWLDYCDCFVLFSLLAYAQVQFEKYVFIYKYVTSQKCHKPLK